MLCPYCDRVLPVFPTPTLVRMLGNIVSKSTADARPTNPMGRKASLTLYAEACQRHTFESQQLPKALGNGWPINIDWVELKDRVQSMKRDLESILLDPGVPIDYGHSKELADPIAGPPGPRMQCVFWQELIKELRESGSRQVTGTAGQLSSFENIRPG